MPNVSRVWFYAVWNERVRPGSPRLGVALTTYSAEWFWRLAIELGAAA
jgi:hypothetical protein